MGPEDKNSQLPQFLDVLSGAHGSEKRDTFQAGLTERMRFTTLRNSVLNAARLAHSNEVALLEQITIIADDEKEDLTKNLWHEKLFRLHFQHFLKESEEGTSAQE